MLDKLCSDVNSSACSQYFGVNESTIYTYKEILIKSYILIG